MQVTKPNGKTRELGILTVRDRIAQRTVLDAIEERFESEMQDCSFAFRFGRNVEMAIQRILVSRANGYWWTFEADIQNYFGSIDRNLLLKDVRRIVPDEQILHLMRLWLDAGMLEETWWYAGGRKVRQAGSLIREAIGEDFDDFAAQRYGLGNGIDVSSAVLGDDLPFGPLDDESRKGLSRREAAKNLLKDGLWYAVSHRAILARILGPKLFGVGGLAVAGIFLAPKIIEAYRQFFHPQKGILQGSPISPVLANFYLNEFDQAFATGPNSLVRYCDDFVVLCRTEAEARQAMLRATHELGKRGVTLHPEKTRILAPTDEFEFLGYRFLSNGMVEPPPSAAEEIARKIREMSVKAASKFRRPDRKFVVSKRASVHR